MTEEASWQCGSSPVRWVGRPNLSACVSTKTVRLKEKIQAREQRPSMVAMEMVDVTRTATYGADVVELTSMMTELVDQVETEVMNLPTEESQIRTEEVSKVM